MRARYSDPKGDLGRAERQRQFLGAVMKQAATPSTVLIPWRWWGFTHTAASSVIVGEDTSCWTPTASCPRCEGLLRRGAQPRRAPVVDEHDDPRRQLGDLGRRAADALFTMLREGEPIEEPPPGTDGEPSGG